MKKIVLSAIMLVSVCFGSTAMAQDNKEVKSCCKAKTEQACKKEAKAGEKACCKMKAAGAKAVKADAKTGATALKAEKKQCAKACKAGEKKCCKAAKAAVAEKK